MSNWIETHMGHRVDPLRLQPEDADLGDIAHALSQLCRFTGHTDRFYSVAQHSVLVASKARNDLEALYFLLHDTAEAYIADIARPVKLRLDGIEQIEKSIHSVILEKLAPEVIAVFKADPAQRYRMDILLTVVDTNMCLTEADQLIAQSDITDWARYLEGSRPYDIDIVPLMPTGAEHSFLQEYFRLKGVLS